MPLSVVFMGTPDFAVPTLSALIAGGHRIEAVYTQPPRPAGRGLAPVPSPVEKAARQSGLVVETPLDFKDEATRATLAAYRPDVVVVVAYGLLLPPAVLAMPPLGCLNLHGSLLPRWRGAAPIQRAIMAGDEMTGIMVMRMEAGLDTGPVALTARCPIAADTTAGDLHDRLMIDGAHLMAEALTHLERGALTFMPQSAEGVVYARKIDKGEAHIDWTKSADEVRRHIHGLSPFPGAWCELRLGDTAERLKILRCEMVEAQGRPGCVLDDKMTIACGEGAIRPLLVQRAGRKAMDTEAVLRGLTIPPGSEFS